MSELFAGFIGFVVVGLYLYYFLVDPILRVFEDD